MQNFKLNMHLTEAEKLYKHPNSIRSRQQGWYHSQSFDLRDSTSEQSLSLDQKIEMKAGMKRANQFSYRNSFR